MHETSHIYSLNPVTHYGIDPCLMRAGDKATFIAVNNLSDFVIESTYLNGYQVYNRFDGIIDSALQVNCVRVATPDHFKAAPIGPDEVKVDFTSDKVKVIEVFDGQLFTAGLYARISGHS